MKSTFLAIIASLIFCGCASSSHDSAEQSVQTRSAKKKPLVIDVRTAGEFKNEHLEQAINIPIDDLTNQIATTAPDKTTPIQVHCQSGGRSARAKKLLEVLGYTQIEDLGSLAHARQVLGGEQPK